MQGNKILKIFKEHKSLLVIALLILVEIIWLISSADSYAFYGTTDELEILRATIGNFAKKSEDLPTNAKEADLNIQLYLQDQADSEKYNLVNNMPTYGYHLNEEMSNCTPSQGELKYTNYSITDGKIKFTVQDENGSKGPKQIVCHIYYDKDFHSDITIYVLVEDEEYGIKEFNNKHYRFLGSVDDITTATSGYTYNSAECSNKEAQIKGFSNGKFNFQSNKPTVCYAYFNK